MNALFITQGLGLKLHYHLMRAIRPHLDLERVGFYASDSMFFRRFAKNEAEFLPGGYSILKEWEILGEAKRVQLDLAYLRKLEQEMDAGPLWDVLVCDRRIMQGRWCKERQDYRPRFTHEEMLRILQVSLRRIEEMFDEVSPDIGFSFVPVTFGEYLFAMIARSRGVPVLFLYPTKIKNYMAWMTSFLGRPDHIVNAYERYEQDGTPDEWRRAAENYLATVEGQEIRHEGMIPIPGKVRTVSSRVPIRNRAWSLLKAEVEYWMSESRNDNHVTGVVLPLAYRKIVSPIRVRMIDARLSRQYLREAGLAKMEYAFYPLHAEPEVALSIHGKAYQNQIETVRNIARSLPAGMKLVTKEHPRCIGYHPYGYYKKLLRIPNVVLADPFIESKTIILHSRLVVTVWSFVGFEAILHQRPVITLGTPPFGILPDSMIRQVRSVNQLHSEICDLLQEYRYNKQSLVSYVAANLRGAVPMDFYSLFLKKQGRYGENGEHAASNQFEEFVRYTIERVRQVCGLTIERGK
jgi:hypothetical protein